MNYLDALRARRSNYILEKTLPIAEEDLISLIKEVGELSPSPFNIQSARMVLLLGDAHDKLWNIVSEALENKINDPEKFQPTKEKIQGFAKGYGTILFYKDVDVVEQIKVQYPNYAEHFDTWSEHANGTLLQSVWTALAAEGIAANIQHYNPLIDEDVAQAFDIPKNYQLIGQMPFGTKTQDVAARTTRDDILLIRK